jgi:hypothetical protein
MENQIVYQELFGHNFLITDVIDAFQSSSLLNEILTIFLVYIMKSGIS